MSVSISNDDECLESGSLSGLSLFLDWHNLHNFILNLSLEEKVDDLVLFDWECKEVDFFEFLDEFLLNETS